MRKDGRKSIFAVVLSWLWKQDQGWTACCQEWWVNVRNCDRKGSDVCCGEEFGLKLQRREAVVAKMLEQRVENVVDNAALGCYESLGGDSSSRESAGKVCKYRDGVFEKSSHNVEQLTNCLTNLLSQGGSRPARTDSENDDTAIDTRQQQLRHSYGKLRAPESLVTGLRSQSCGKKVPDATSLSDFTTSQTPSSQKSRQTNTCSWPRQDIKPGNQTNPSQGGKPDGGRQSVIITMSQFKDAASGSEIVQSTMSEIVENIDLQRTVKQNTIRSVTTPVRVERVSQEKYRSHQTPPSRGFSTRSPSRQYSSRSAYEDMIENKKRYNLQMQTDPQYERHSPNLNVSTPRHDLLRTQSDKIDYQGFLEDRNPSASPSRICSSYSTSNRNSTRQYNNRSPLLDLREHQNAYVNSLPRDEDHDRQWSSLPETPVRNHSQSNSSTTLSNWQTPRANHSRTESDVSVKRFSVFNDISRSGLLPFYTEGTLDPPIPVVRRLEPVNAYERIPIPPIPESPPVQTAGKGIKKATSFKNLLRKMSEPKQQKAELKRQEKEARRVQAGKAARLRSEAIKRQAAEVEKAKEEMLRKLKEEQDRESAAERFAITSTITSSLLMRC